MPDSLEYSAMHLKTISWLGNIYEKFESLCLEVEEDAVKYVGSHVQTVGESVKKFYSEVMQDLHPESYVDPVKVAQNEVEKKAKANLKEQPESVDMELAEDTEVIEGENNLEGIHEGQRLGIIENSRDNHFLLKMAGSVTPLSAERNKMSSVCENSEGYSMASDQITVALPEFGTSIDGATSDMSLSADSTGLKQEDSEFSSSLARGCASKETTLEIWDPKISSLGGPSLRSSAWTHINDDRVDQTSSGASTNTIGKESAERSQNCNSDVVETFDVTEQVVEMVELIDEQQLEETCVLVEGEKLCFPQQPVKRKSYKKKIQEAFCSKKGSTREYEHLIAQLEGQPLNQEAEENVMMPALVEKSKPKLSASDFPDSEWELV